MILKPVFGKEITLREDWVTVGVLICCCVVKVIWSLTFIVCELEENAPIKAWLDRLLSNLVWWKVSPPMTGWSLEGPFQPKPSCGSVFWHPHVTLHYVLLHVSWVVVSESQNYYVWNGLLEVSLSGTLAHAGPSGVGCISVFWVLQRREITRAPWTACPHKRDTLVSNTFWWVFAGLCNSSMSLCGV